MTTAELIERVLDQLNRNVIFYPQAEIVTNGINPALRLLCLLKPTLLTKRAVVSLQPEEVFLDLRVLAPRSFRIQRVAIGDISNDIPVASQGRSGDLRRTSLAALRGQRDWFSKKKAFPETYYTHGLLWLGLHPRFTQALTVSLVFSALPQPLAVEQPTGEPETPRQWDSVLSDIATCILEAKEGSGEVEKAMERLSKILGDEPFKQLLKILKAERLKQQYAGMRPSA